MRYYFKDYFGRTNFMIKNSPIVISKPFFRIFDYQKVLEFYEDWLGFTIDWEHRFGEKNPLFISGFPLVISYFICPNIMVIVPLVAGD